MFRHSRESRPVYFAVKFILLGKVKKNILHTESDIQYAVNVKATASLLNVHAND
jgi:hypothetical protein